MKNTNRNTLGKFSIRHMLLSWCNIWCEIMCTYLSNWARYLMLNESHMTVLWFNLTSMDQLDRTNLILPTFFLGIPIPISIQHILYCALCIFLSESESTTKLKDTSPIVVVIYKGLLLLIFKIWILSHQKHVTLCPCGSWLE